MNKNFIYKTATISGLFLGAFVLSAIAGTWTPAPSSPPSDNTDAPLNVGTSEQTKLGKFNIGDTFTTKKGVLINTDTVSPATNGLEVWGQTLMHGLTSVESLKITSATTEGKYLKVGDSAGNIILGDAPTGGSVAATASQIYCKASGGANTTFLESVGYDSLLGSTEAQCPVGKTLVYWGVYFEAFHQNDSGNAVNGRALVTGRPSLNKISCVSYSISGSMNAVGGVGLCI